MDCANKINTSIESLPSHSEDHLKYVIATGSDPEIKLVSMSGDVTFSLSREQYLVADNNTQIQIDPECCYEFSFLVTLPEVSWISFGINPYDSEGKHLKCTRLTDGEQSNFFTKYLLLPRRVSYYAFHLLVYGSRFDTSRDLIDSIAEYSHLVLPEGSTSIQPFVFLHSGEAFIRSMKVRCLGKGHGKKQFQRTNDKTHKPITDPRYSSVNINNSIV